MLLEQLEPRQLLATFAQAGTTLNLDLNAANESVGVTSSGTSYTLTTTGTWSGTNSVNVTGNGTGTLTVTAAGLAAIDTVAVTDSASGTAVTFNNSAANAYSDTFSIVLDAAAAGTITFNGATSFSGTAGLSASTSGNIAANSGSSITTAGGNAWLSANGALTIGSNVTLNSGAGTLSLGADTKPDGSADDGTGALSIGAGAKVYGADLVLRGADVSTDATATVSSAAVEPQASTFISSGLSQPFDVAFDGSGVAYVSSLGGGTVTKFSASGALLSTFVTGLSGPAGLAFDGAGNLYVANYYGGTIAKVTPGGSVSTFVSGLNKPVGLAFDSASNLYVGNTGDSTVRKVTPAGAASTFIGSGLNKPYDVAVDANGNVYVANGVANTISKATPAGVVSTFVDATHGLGFPQGLTFDPAGNLYVANGSGGFISKVTPSGTVSTYISSGLINAAGIAFDGIGNLYIASGGGTGAVMTKVTPAVTATDTVSITAGTGTLAGPLVSTGGVSVTNSGATTISGVLSGAGGVTKAGAGTLTFDAYNTFTGGTTVDAGTLQLNKGGATGTIRGALTINSGAIVEGLVGDAFGYDDGVKVDTLTINSGTLTTAVGLTLSSMAITMKGGVMQGTGGARLDFYNNGSGPTTLVIDGSATSTATVSGSVWLRQDDTTWTVNDGSAAVDLLVSGDIVSVSGNGALIKAGSGTLDLAGGNTYTGATTVNAGTLLVNGSTAASSAVSVASGATLGGQGTISGPVSVDGTLAPGNSPGILNTGNVSFQDNSTFAVEIGGATPGNAAGNHDQLNVTGAVTIGSNVTLTAATVGGFVPAGQTLVLINNDGTDAISGRFLNLNEGATVTVGGYDYAITYSGGDGNDVVLRETTPPTVASIQRQNPTAVLTNADQVTFRVAFSENVLHVDAADFTLSGPAAADGVIGAPVAVDGDERLRRDGHRPDQQQRDGQPGVRRRAEHHGCGGQCLDRHGAGNQRRLYPRQPGADDGEHPATKSGRRLDERRPGHVPGYVQRERAARRRSGLHLVRFGRCRRRRRLAGRRDGDERL